eukprot:gene22768-11806_t
MVGAWVGPVAAVVMATGNGGIRVAISRVPVHPDTGGHFTLTMSGPADAWFAVGFGGTAGATGAERMGD